ncbi:MAG: T9SS type A sorting domain-containing protein, partial [Bacteroidota bacterium]
NEALKTYLDNGGMLWLQSKNFLFERYAVDDVFTTGDFVYDYLGITKYAIRTPSSSDVTVGIPQFDLVVENNFTSTVDPLTWAWSTMWGVDAFEIAATAKSIYITGPSTHQHAGYVGSVYNELTDGFKVLTTAVETGKLGTVDMTNQFIKETLDYFNQYSEPKVPVTDIVVSATDDAIELDLESTLQFTATITPADASNPTVAWSINDGANASINQNGLLSSTAIPENVTITATANDGSGVSDTYAVEIKSLILDSLSILLVQDNSSNPERIDAIKAAITEAGYKYSVFDAVAHEQSPSAEFLAPFELVIWYTGNDEDGTYLWNGDDTDNAALKTYLDNGGMLWLQGLTFLYDRYDVAPQNFTTGDFAYDYLGAQKFAVSSYMNDSYTGVSQLDLVAANGICTIDPLNWIGDKAEQYVAGCELIAGTQDVYQMGPTGYTLEGNSSAFYNEVTDGFKALSFTFDPSQLKTNLNPLYKEVLDYFNGFANTAKIHVYDVAVSSETGDVTITAENGTLQLVATVLPEGAENKTVTWSLGEGSVPATISPDGLLTASGTLEGNGSVFAIATSNDKPEFADTLEISIIGQAMTGFTVLLVNDNDGSGFNERYLNINTALTESGYAHILYNTETAGSAPSADYMSHFDMVFWYTGNDYIDLYLWDVSDTTANGANAVKANPAIIDYIDNGGIFFHTGLEIMRDIWGRPDDDLGGAGQTIDFAAGDFIYDYMGINQYIRTGKNEDGTSHIEITAENEVTTTSPISFAWSTMWHAAAYVPTDNATSLYTLPSSANVWSGIPTIIMNKPATDGTVIMNGSELAMLGDGLTQVQETVNDVTKEFIDYFANLDPNAISKIERNTLSFSMFPNPTSDELNIKFAMTSSEKVEIVVFDNTGHRVIQKEMNARPGINSQKLNVRNLSSGIYFMSIHTNNSISSSKFIVD